MAEIHFSKKGGGAALLRNVFISTLLAACLSAHQEELWESVIVSTPIQSNENVSVRSVLTTPRASLYSGTCATVNLIFGVMGNAGNPNSSLMASCHSCWMGEESGSDFYSDVSSGETRLLILEQNPTFEAARKTDCLPFLIFIMS